MRRHSVLPLPPLICLVWLSGCVPETVFHRTIPDLVYSAISGRNCSLVRLDRGQTYCKPVDPPVPPIPYCTRSLAGVDCWAHPELMPGIPTQIAQGPHTLTPEQNQARLARWPD